MYMDVYMSALFFFSAIGRALTIDVYSDGRTPTPVPRVVVQSGPVAEMVYSFPATGITLNDTHARIPMYKNIVAG